MKLFNRLNWDGAVATPRGKVPSFAPFLGKAFLGQISHNTSEKTGKTYPNLDKDGVYNVGAPRTPVTDDLGTPTGEYTDIPVAEMNGEQRCFLWETGVSDEVYKQMWDSIAIVGEKKDGTPFRNWMQERILSEDNIALPGSRAQRLFGQSAEEDQLDGLIEAAASTPDMDSLPETNTPASPVVDPLAALDLSEDAPF